MNQPRIEKNSLFELEIEGMSNEGNGISRIDGYVVFIPNTAIGDRCLVRLIKCNKNYGYGRAEKILSPSPDRIDSDCKDFPQCGGCVFRHITYQSELLLKENYVKDCFERLGNLHIPVSPIIGCTKQIAYRNKAQYPVGISKDNQIISGFYAKRSHRIISEEVCMLQPKIFHEIKEEILFFLKENQISIYDEQSKKGLIRHIYLRQGEATGEIMVCLIATKKNIPNISNLVSRLVKRWNQIKSIIINLNSKNTNVILGDNSITVYGKNTITDILCGLKIELSPLSFYQVNHTQTEVLYRLAAQVADLKPNDILLDLYCGAGTIGLSMAPQVKKLIGVEIVPQAVVNAKKNAEQNAISNAHFLCADAGTAALQLADEGVKPSIIIVDPPRKGLDLSVIDAIQKLSPAKLVMISCNPATAVRDVSLLIEKGYQIQSVTPVDLFPRTAHVEVVIQMTFCGSDKKNKE